MAIEIQTTQNVVLNFREAGLGPRIVARLLDGLFIFMWVVSCSILFSYSFSFYSDAYTVMLILIIIPIVFYDLILEKFNNGQSFGKKIMKIRVVNLDGTTPSFGSYLIRWLFRLVDFTLTGSLLAVLMVAFSDKSQRLGDYLAGTTVITLKDEKDSESILLPDINLKEDYPVTYSDVLDKLDDKDIQTVRSILNDYRYYNDYYTQRHLADRIKAVTGYTFEGSDRDFLKKVVDDYNYLSLQ